MSRTKRENWFQRKKNITQKMAPCYKKILSVITDLAADLACRARHIAVVFFNQTESADSLHFFWAKLQIDPGNASNALKIGVDPFHYAPNRLRGSV